jgi:hypothetical protein
MELNKELPKATFEQVFERIRHFVGSTGGGQWSFMLDCKCCKDVGTISCKERDLQSQKQKEKVALHFVQQGWRFDDHELVCPYCFKIKS